MRKICVIIMTLILATVGLCGCDDGAEQAVKSVVSEVTEDSYVTGVKNAKPSFCPDKTYGDAFSDFFASPAWEHFTGTVEGPDEDGDGTPDYIEENVEIVEFSGRCFYKDVEVTALIQFTLDMKNNTFEPTYLSFNDLPQNRLILMGLLYKAFNVEEE